MADDRPHDDLSELVQASQPGIQVFWITGATKQAMAERLALILSEHVSPDHEYQLSYNAMQVGWDTPPAQKPGIFRAGNPNPRTTLHFEHTVIVTIRERTTP